MRLPNAERAVVAMEKITEHLLNSDNPRNRVKAAFFTRFGFTIDDWQVLAAALRQIATTDDVRETKADSFGVRYVAIGRLSLPDHRDPLVKTIWQVDNGGTVPRFISANPA